MRIGASGPAQDLPENGVTAELEDESLMAVEVCGLAKDFGQSVPSAGAKQEVDLGIGQLRSQAAKIPSYQQI